MSTTHLKSKKKDYFDNAYQYLFDPRHIVVVGASNNALKPGGRVMKNIIDHGYKGKLWAVNPKTAEIMGQKTFTSIDKLPEAPDLAIVAVPSKFAVATIKALADKGTGAVIVLTSGFGEKDEAGKKAEEEMLQIAHGAQMTLVGPNCSGFLTKSFKGKFAGIIPTRPGGAVDIISGSGATVDYVMERGHNRGLSFGNVINLGNSIQLGVEDLVQIYDENYGPDSARILMLYMESIKKPAKLLRHAASLVGKGCAIVGIKSGATAAGERAAASHTGAMATSDTAVGALFEKAGILRVESRAEMINAACVLSAAKGLLKGNRVCVLTDAGGPGVMMSDELARHGMELPLLTPKTRDLLGEILPAESSTANPIDALPSRTADQIKAVTQVLGDNESDTVDAIAILLGDSGMSDNTQIYQAISEAMDHCPIPIFPMFSSVFSSVAIIDDFASRGKVFFPDEVPLAKALANVAHLRKPERASADLDHYDKAAVARVLEGQSGALSPEAVTGVLQAAGFKLPRQVEVFKQEDLAVSCAQVGYPLVMKVIGPLHKTDVGGVKLGIANDEEALRAWGEMLSIDNAEGVLLQPMVSGIEVILGASREGDFGHLIMFGLGGIYTEVLKDVQFGLAPLTQAESRRMIRGIRSYAILEGVRGEPGMALDVLVDNVQRLSLLVHDFPQIEEIDLNPIKGTGADLFAVDARIILET
ncbi:MAG: acetate--CoA ligase family protein [Desulfobacteraceae bacterium]|jgi:acetyltransferase